jgi:hypothetical protein
MEYEDCVAEEFLSALRNFLKFFFGCALLIAYLHVTDDCLVI